MKSAKEKNENERKDKFPPHMKKWEKALTFSFLSLALVVSALGIFQCISLLTSVYFQANISAARSTNLGLVFLGLITFACWAVASAYLFSDFVARYLIPKSWI